MEETVLESKVVDISPIYINLHANQWKNKGNTSKSLMYCFSRVKVKEPLAFSLVNGNYKIYVNRLFK